MIEKKNIDDMNTLMVLKENIKNGVNDFYKKITKDMILTSFIGFFILIATIVLKLSFDLVFKRIYSMSFLQIFKELSLVSSFAILTPTILVFIRSYLDNRVLSVKGVNKMKKRMISEKFVETKGKEIEKEDSNDLINALHEIIRDIRSINDSNIQDMLIMKLENIINHFEEYLTNPSMENVLKNEIEEITCMIQSLKRRSFPKEEKEISDKIKKMF